MIQYRDNKLYVDGVSCLDITNQYDTPCYVYSKSALVSNWRAFDNAFNNIPHQICYAVKANSNLAILHTLASLHSGFDIVSKGELERVLKAGGDASKIIYSGVGKTAAELEFAIQQKVKCINVESLAEFDRLQTMAKRLKTTVNIALRINPNIDANTHAHIATGLKDNKFGIQLDDVVPLCKQIQTCPDIRLVGIGCHIGSQITAIEPFIDALDSMLAIHRTLHDLNIKINHLNLGGGLGISYDTESPPNLDQYASEIKKRLANTSLQLILEPGRAIAGNAGILLTKVEYLKHNSDIHFAIVDAGMNDFLRPALYDAWQTILPVTKREGVAMQYDVVGPVCESADYLGKQRLLTIEQGDLLAITCVGAYGFSMSSNYNSRCRPAEVMVDGDDAHLIRKRETIEALYATEMIP